MVPKPTLDKQTPDRQTRHNKPETLQTLDITNARRKKTLDITNARHSETLVITNARHNKY